MTNHAEAPGRRWRDLGRAIEVTPGAVIFRLKTFWHSIENGKDIRHDCAPVLGAERGSWVAFAGAEQSGLAVESLSANFVVPPEPLEDSGQTLYFFPSLQSDHVAIIQTVLRWGNLGSGKSFWSIASWAVSRKGCAFRTRFTRVAPGDRLHGTIVRSDDRYVCEFTGVAESRLTIRLARDEVYTRANIALETYDVRSNAGLPGGDGVEFTNVKVRMEDGTVPDWTVHTAPNHFGERAVILDQSSHPAGGRIRIRY